MTNAELVELGNRCLFPVYPRADVAFVRGDGARVWDADGKSYLDFFSSTVVTVLGHCHPAVTRALEQQARRILQVSNLHHCEPQARLAELLVRHSFADRVFFCNSGAEANEAAIKLARKYGHDRRGGAFEIITALGSFHGRTLATIAATGQEKVRVGFEPVPAGFRYAPFDDIDALAAAITERTVAVMVEPIQGEGGVRVPRDNYLENLRRLCDDRGLLLILDEVQTGMGRTGTLFAHEQAGITPDIMTLAKGLGNGVPIGAMMATENAAASFDVGAHGSTFGGNALACAAGAAVLQTLLGHGVLERGRQIGERLMAGLEKMRTAHSAIREVRGRGLLIGAELNRPAGPVVAHCLSSGLIANNAGPSVLRLAPPLVVTESEVDEALAVIGEALES